MSTPYTGMTAAARDLVVTHPELFHKLASGILASTLPSVSAALAAFHASRQQQAYEDAQKEQARFPALHATQPDIARAQMQMAYGSDPYFR